MIIFSQAVWRSWTTPSLRWHRQRVLHQRPHFVVLRAIGYGSVPQQDSTRVGIDNEDLVIGCIEQYGIRSFMAHALERQQLCPQRRRRSREHPLQRAGVPIIQEAYEALQAVRLLPVVAR